MDYCLGGQCESDAASNRSGVGILRENRLIALKQIQPSERRAASIYAAIAFFLLLLTYDLCAQVPAVEPGHSAHWFNPERSGEGLVLEVLGDEKAVIYWFTYDDEGNQRWLFDVGNIQGDTIIFPALTATEGAKFGSEYDPDDVETEVVGDADFRVIDCERAEWSFNAFGQSHTYEMTRLTRTMGAGCASLNGVPGYPVKGYAGQSGSWFDPSHSGEGYTLQWMSRNEAVLVWFTYDTKGNQYWMIGVGEREGDEIVFPALHSTTGGKFGEQFDPEDLISSDWGSLTIDIGCDQGVARYDSKEDAFGEGQLSLTRLSSLGSIPCPWEEPNIIDLYNFELDTVYEGSENIEAQSISNNGVIVGRLNTDEGPRAIRWTPEAREWVTLPSEIGGRPVQVSEDGSQILTNQAVGGEQGEFYYPIFWIEGTGWRPISDTVFDESIYFGASQSLAQVVGNGQLSDGGPRSYPWIWNEGAGQIELPLTDEIPGATPRGVANDGSVVVGTSIIDGGAGPVSFREIAVRWEDLGDPDWLRDDLGSRLGRTSTCNSDCSIVFGAEQAEFDPEHPNFREAWYWTQSTGAGYMGKLQEAVDDATVAPALPLATTSDGTMAVGSYPRFNDAGRPGTGGFIWTMNTGLVSVFSIFDQLDIGGEEWEYLTAFDISPDGSMILLTGYERSGSGPTQENLYRVQVLKLAKAEQKP